MKGGQRGFRGGFLVAKVNYSNVRNPRWANNEKTAIDVVMNVDYLKGDIPFTATCYDTEPHGREIFVRCLQGDFGEIADWAGVGQEGINGEISYSPVATPWIIAWPDFQEFLDEANRENASGSERGVVLVCAALLDDLLLRMLQEFLIEDTVEFKRLIADVNAPISGFSNRAKLSFLLGLISKGEFDTCTKISKIRNSFAHKTRLPVSANESDSVDHLFQVLWEGHLQETLVWSALTHEQKVRLVYAGVCVSLAISFASRLDQISADRRVNGTDGQV